MITELLAPPDAISLTSVWVLALTSLVASFISGVMGLGGATLLLGVMAIVLPPAALIPLHAVIQVASTGLRGLLLLPHIRNTLLLPFVLGSAAGSLLSGALVIQLPSWAIQFGIALFILWSVFGKLGASGRGGALLIGGFTGFLTMLFGATGPFVSAFVRNQNLPRLSHVGTQAAMMTFQHTIKMLVFGLFGFAFGAWAGLLGIMIIASMVGTSIGRLALGKVNEESFRRLLDLLLIALACRLIWQGSSDLLAPY